MESAQDQNHAPSASRRSAGRRKLLLGVGAVVIVFVGWLGFELFRALTAQPGSGVDFNGVMWDHVAQNQNRLPGTIDGLAEPSRTDDAWRLMKDAILVMDEVEAAAIDEVSGELRVTRCEYDEIGRGGRDTAVLEAGEFDAEMGGLRYDAGVSAIRLAGDTELDALLDRLARTPRGQREKSTGKLLEILLPNLSEARKMAKFNAARMRLARDAADDAAFLRHTEQTLAVARTVGNQMVLIDRLVGQAIEGLVFREIIEFVRLRRPDAATCRALMDILDRQNLIPELAFHMESEHIAVRDVIQWTHTEDGRLMLSEVSDLTGLAGGGPAVPNSKIMNMGHMFFPTKDETLAKTAEVFDRMIEQSRMTVTEWDALEYTDVFVDIPDRYVLLHVMLPALGRTVFTNWILQTQRDGLDLVLAIRAYEAENGALPEMLEALVPAYVEALPPDPFAEQGTLVYRVLGEPDERGLRYLLYSVGRDGEDNGGAASERMRDAAYSTDRGKGFDLPLNRVED